MAEAFVGRMGATKYAPEGGKLLLTKYVSNGVLALLLTNEEGERELTCSVNLRNPPAEGCLWIKDYSENEGVLEALIEADIVRMTDRTERSGYSVLYECKLLVPVPDDVEYAGSQMEGNV